MPGEGSKMIEAIVSGRISFLGRAFICVAIAGFGLLSTAPSADAERIREVAINIPFDISLGEDKTSVELYCSVLYTRLGSELPAQVSVPLERGRARGVVRLLHNQNVEGSAPTVEVNQDGTLLTTSPQARALRTLLEWVNLPWDPNRNDSVSAGCFVNHDGERFHTRRSFSPADNELSAEALLQSNPPGRATTRPAMQADGSLQGLQNLLTGNQ